MVVFEDTRGMLVTLRRFAVIAEIVLVVGENDVDVVSIRPQRNRMGVTVRADPEGECGGYERGAKGRRGTGEREQQGSGEQSDSGGFHVSRSSA